MLMYIDPSTVSMLIAVIIGMTSVILYGVRRAHSSLYSKISSRKMEDINYSKIPLVIFSDNKAYWQTFYPVCRELDKRGIDVLYLTMSENDSGLTNNFEHIRAEYIGTGGKAFAKMNFLNAKIVLASTPGLNVYQWHRSKNTEYYVYLPHSANDAVAGNHMFGLDFYDAVLLSGSYQEEDLRYLEKIRNLPAKETAMVGVPYMDEMLNRVNQLSVSSDNTKTTDTEYTVLVSPTWGKTSLLNKFGDELLIALKETGYHIIIRPHPQSYIEEKDMNDLKILNKYMLQ